jgi:hypothetical protein
MVFRWLGTILNDPLLSQKYDSLTELFLKDPLKPLSKRYKRPPIKHVIMIYGVDLPTEIGYVYRSADTKSEDSSNMYSKENYNKDNEMNRKDKETRYKGAILDEIYYEQSCGTYSVKHSQQQINNHNNNNNDNKKSDNGTNSRERDNYHDSKNNDKQLVKVNDGNLNIDQFIPQTNLITQKMSTTLLLIQLHQIH